MDEHWTGIYRRPLQIILSMGDLWNIFYRQKTFPRNSVYRRPVKGSANRRRVDSLITIESIPRPVLENIFSQEKFFKGPTNYHLFPICLSIANLIKGILSSILSRDRSFVNNRHIAGENIWKVFYRKKIFLRFSIVRRKLTSVSIHGRSAKKSSV